MKAATRAKPRSCIKPVHYKFESELPDGYSFDKDGNEVTIEASGKFWKILRFPTSIPQINWIGNLKDLPGNGSYDKPGGCAKCHIGTGMKPFTFDGVTSAPLTG